VTVIINPGSGPVPRSGQGWTNTVEQARRNAEEWLDRMRADGIQDVELLDSITIRDGRWVFYFRHAVTGVEVELETHGLTDDGYHAYERERIFGPRTYWNGSSTSAPEIEQWAAPGFEVIKTLRRADAP
jgi:hypothetical protein